MRKIKSMRLAYKNQDEKQTFTFYMNEKSEIEVIAKDGYTFKGEIVDFAKIAFEMFEVAKAEKVHFMLLCERSAFHLD